MKLKRLIVQGFKSFKDRTTIHFDEGITGIVGPNGCGKSNIVDALFWIMGEQSAKHLRGSSMKDVIFAGSSKYPPANWAEATLVLENTAGKHIHIGNKVANPSEIQLTRKLYRNGESEYRINDTIARLKDIQEVFMDTGAGAKSYSIIAQGEINRLVQAKPEERRVMIEEVAGITKFKLRKRESLKKIEYTQANLARLQDLMVEIEKSLKSLEKQAEKAEKARSLKERVRKYELVVGSHRVYDYLKSLRESLSFLGEARTNLENWKLNKNNLENSLAEERFQKDEQTEKIDEAQSEFNKISKQLAADEERLNYLCKSLTEKESQLETREAELGDIITELEERNLKKIELTSQKEEIERSKEENVDFSDMEDRVQFLKEELESRVDELKELRDGLEKSSREYSSKDQELFKISSKLEDYAKTLQETTKEIEELEKQFSGVSTMIAEQRENVTLLESNVLESEEELKKAKELISTTEKEHKLNEENKKQAYQELVKLESKLNSLRELNESLEGASEGTTRFMDEQKDKGFEILGQVIKCQDGYSSAIQSLLGQLSEAVLKGDKANSTDMIEWMSKNEQLGLSFVHSWQVSDSAKTISEELLERLQIKGLSGIKPVAEVLNVSDELRSKIEKYLGLAFIVDNLSAKTAESLTDDLNFDYLVSLDGHFLVTKRNGMILFNHAVNKNCAGIVERNNKIDQLEKEFNDLQNHYSSTNAKFEESLAKKNDALVEFETLNTQYQSLKHDFIAKKSSLDSKLDGFKSFTTRMDILNNRKTEASKGRLNLLEQEESLRTSLEMLKGNVDSSKGQITDLEERLSDLRSTYEAEREELLRLQAEASSWEQRINAMASQVGDIDNQISKYSTRKESLHEMIEKYRLEIEQISNDLKMLEESNQQTAQVLQDKEEILGLMKDQFSELLIGMQERENEVRELNSKIVKTEKEMVEHEVRSQKIIEEESQLVRDIFEKYRVDLRECIGVHLELTESEFSQLTDVSSMKFMEGTDGQVEISAEPYEFTRRYGQDLKDCSEKLKNSKVELQRLGEINWQAIEDYERQKLRFDFLRIQELELKKSLEDLLNAISKIDEKSRERFKYAFDEVDSRFQKVFPIIFGGGNARLNIVGDLDDPECGVDIIAQPPGKKMQHINLMSGGEKALTAVSLIFSIFLVKPSPFCLLDEVDAPLDDANVGRFNELLREMSKDSQFILITHNKKTMELNDTLYGVTMQEPGVSKAVSVQLH